MTHAHSLTHALKHTHHTQIPISNSSSLSLSLSLPLPLALALALALALWLSHSFALSHTRSLSLSPPFIYRPTAEGVEWPAFNSNTVSNNSTTMHSNAVSNNSTTMHFRQNESVAEQNLRGARCDFWDALFYEGLGGTSTNGIMPASRGRLRATT